MKKAENAKKRKTNAPTSVTVLTEIRCAIIRPPMTANPVHMPWPIVPPSTVPMMFSRAPNIIVDICDRSPHSARNVSTNACNNIAERYFRNITTKRLANNLIERND